MQSLGLGLAGTERAPGVVFFQLQLVSHVVDVGRSRAPICEDQGLQKCNGYPGKRKVCSKWASRRRNTAPGRSFKEPPPKGNFWNMASWLVMSSSEAGVRLSRVLHTEGSFLASFLHPPSAY